MDPPFPMMDPPMPIPDDPRAESPDAESYDDEPAEDYDDASSSAAANNPALTATEDDEGEPTVYSSVRSLQCLSHLRDISDSAVAWQVSSAKPGNGVEQLRDPGTDTYWQSDGTTQPHYIQIHFHRRVAVTHVALYLDYQLDESYTPKTIQLETGMTSQDLICASAQNQCMELHEPSGWVILPVYSSLEHSAHNTAHSQQQRQQQQMHTTSKAHLLRISILSMAQNGRDTHVRRVAIFAERSNTTTTAVPLSLLPAKRKTRKSVHHRTSSNSEDEEDDDDDDEDEDLSLLTRGLGLSTLGMPTTTFATTIR